MNSAALHANSPLCRALGLTTSVRLPAAWYAWCTAFAAVIVDFPHCRVQFNRPRLPSHPSTRACCASGSNPSFYLTHAAASPAGAASTRGRGIHPPRRPCLSVFHIDPPRRTIPPPGFCPNGPFQNLRSFVKRTTGVSRLGDLSREFWSQLDLETEVFEAGQQSVASALRVEAVEVVGPVFAIRCAVADHQVGDPKDAVGHGE